MTLHRLPTLAAAALLAAAFWWSALLVGTRLARALRQGPAPATTRTALGFAAYALTGVLLGAVGALWWPLLAVLALLPAVVAAPAAVRRSWRPRARELLATVRESPELALVAAVVTTVYAAVATLPVFHYDLLTNYVGVSVEYLLAHSTAPLPHNVFSTASLPLHALLAYPVALDALLRDGPFAFGWGTTFGFFHLLCIAGCAWALWEAARPLAPRAAAAAAALAAALWLTMPQSLLLATVKNAEFVTTFVALAVAAGVAASPTAGALAVGALCGLLMAAKAQYGAWALAALAVLLYRRRSLRTALAFAAGGAVMVLPQLARAWIDFGSPLFPYAGGAGLWRRIAEVWLATNAVHLPANPLELGDRLLHLVTLQPETGVTLVLLPMALARRVRLGPLWFFIVLPVLGLSLTSSATYHVLRWVQPALAVALLGAAGNLAELTHRWRTARWALAVVPLLSLLLAVRFASSLVGGPGLLLLSPERVVERQLPSLESREDLVALAPERVLYVGEIDADYGAENGVIPAPPSAAVLDQWLGADSPDEIAGRLRAAGFELLAINPKPAPSVARGGYWAWSDPAERAALAALLAGSRRVPVRGPLEVWRILPTAPASPPSPP